MSVLHFRNLAINEKNYFEDKLVCSIGNYVLIH